MSDSISPFSSSSLPSAVSEVRQPLEVFVVRPAGHRYWVHLLLLAATFFSTLVVGARMEFNFLHHLPAFYAGEDSLAFFPVFWAIKGGHFCWDSVFVDLDADFAGARDGALPFIAGDYRVWAQRCRSSYRVHPLSGRWARSFASGPQSVPARRCLISASQAPSPDLWLPCSSWPFRSGMSQPALPFVVRRSIQLNSPLIF